MQFNLTNDLVFFDLEATGLNVLRDRIVQIGMIKYFKDGRDPEQFETLINPGVPISEEAMAVHRITPQMVANQPTFIQLAQEIYDFIGNSDLAGYNSNRFDIPMLLEEFHRAEIEFDVDGRRTIDIQRIFYKMEPRTLKAAYKFYCNQEMENAHDALADVKATIDVFKGQLERYQDVDMIDEDGNIVSQPVKNDMQAIYEFTCDTNMIDATQRLKYDQNGVVIFNFGKYNGLPVAESLARDKQYYFWILEKEFSQQVKQAVKKLVKEYEDALKKV